LSLINKFNDNSRSSVFFYQFNKGLLDGINSMNLLFDSIEIYQNENPLFIECLRDYRMPNELFDQLEGLTVNIGVEAGIISNIGNDQGDFYFYWEEFNIYYVLIDGYSLLIPNEYVKDINDVNELFDWKIIRDEFNNQCLVNI
jgi:hypothetical protein